jgi:hypothetical protein
VKHYAAPTAEHAVVDEDGAMPFGEDLPERPVSAVVQGKLEARAETLVPFEPVLIEIALQGRDRVRIVGRHVGKPIDFVGVVALRLRHEFGSRPGYEDNTIELVAVNLRQPPLQQFRGLRCWLGVRETPRVQHPVVLALRVVLRLIGINLDPSPVARHRGHEVDVKIEYTVWKVSQGRYPPFPAVRPTGFDLAVSGGDWPSKILEYA